MKIIKILSYLSLLLMLTSSILTFNGTVSIESNKMYILVLTAIWFLTAPFWMGKEEKSNEES